MDNSNNKPCKPGCQNASAPKKSTTIKQHITLPHSGSSSSPSTNPPPGSQCPYVSNYVQPADTFISTTIPNCNNKQTAPVEQNKSSCCRQDHKRDGKPSKEKINIIQTVDIVVKPKNSQLVNVDVMPTSSQAGNDQNMIIPIHLQFCPDTCPENQKISEDVTILHEASKCGETVKSANVCRDTCPGNKKKSSEITDANEFKTKMSEAAGTIKLSNCVDTYPRKQKPTSEVTDQTENINKISKYNKFVKPNNICLDTCPKNKKLSSDEPGEEVKIPKSTERQPTRYCFAPCAKKSKILEEINDEHDETSKSSTSNSCSRNTCPKKRKSAVQNEINNRPGYAVINKPKTVCPDTCQKHRKSTEVASEAPPDSPPEGPPEDPPEALPEAPSETPEDSAEPPNDPLEIVKPSKRTRLLYKVCKPEFEQYMEYAEPCEETASESSEEPVAHSVATESMEEVRSAPWYGVLHDCQFQEAYVCDDCTMQESVEVQTELVLGENLFSQSLNSVTDAEKNQSENQSNHTLEIDTFYLPPTGTLEILKVQKKGDLPDIDKIVIVQEENREMAKSTNVTSKQKIPPKKKRCKGCSPLSCSPCCKKPQEEDEEPYAPSLPPPLPPRKIDFVFATDCNEHEPYNKLLHKYFPSPEQNTEPCTTQMEMPWDKILLPANPKIRQTTALNFEKKELISESPAEENIVADEPEPLIAEINSSVSEPSLSKNKIDEEPQPTPVESSKSCTVSKVSSVEFETNNSAPAVESCSCDTNKLTAIKTIITSKGLNKGGTMVTRLSLNTAKQPDSKSITCRYLNSNMLSESESKKADAPCANTTCDDRSMPTNKVDRDPSETSATSITSTSVPLKQDIVFQAFKSCEEELKPLRATLVELQTKLRKLNMPELDCLFSKNEPVEDVPDRPQTGGTTAKTQQFCSLPSKTMSSQWQTLPRQIEYPQYPKQSTPPDYNVNPIGNYFCDYTSRPNSGEYTQNRPTSGASCSPQNFQTFPTISEYSAGGWNPPNQYSPMQQQDPMQFSGGQHFQSIPMGSCSSNSNSRPGTRGNQVPMQYPPAQNYQPYPMGNYGNSGGPGYYNSRPATTGNSYEPQFQSIPMSSCTCSGGPNDLNNMQYVSGPYSRDQNNGPQLQWNDMPMTYYVPQYKNPGYYPDMNSGRSSEWNTIPPTYANSSARQLIQNCREVPTHDKYKTVPTCSDPNSSGSGTDNKCYNYCIQFDQTRNKNHSRKRGSSACPAPCQSSNSRRPYSQGPPMSRHPISIEMKNIYTAGMQNFVSTNPVSTDYNRQAPTMPPYPIQAFNSTPYSIQRPPHYNAFMPGQFEAMQSTPYNVDNRFYDNFQPKFNSSSNACESERYPPSERSKKRNKGIQKCGKRRTPTKKVRVPQCIKPVSSTTSNDTEGKIVKRSCKPKKKCSSDATNTQSSESVCPFIDAIKSILLIDDKKMIKTGPYDYSYDSSFFTKKLKNMRLHLRVRPSKKKTQ